MHVHHFQQNDQLNLYFHIFIFHIFIFLENKNKTNKQKQNYKPDVLQCNSAPPSCSAETVSPVAAFTSGGPPKKIVPVFVTIT